jgi:methyl-accepting chemotaxis protein
MNALDNLRLKTSYGVLGLLWVNFVLFCIAGALGPDGFSLPAVIASLAVAGIASASWAKDKAGPTTRIVTSMALGVQVAMLVYAFSGSSYQIDMHMYFFATLAICAAWVDWRAIVAYAALVAVHHLVLYVAFPAAVFPGASDFSRVLLHAVVLIVQSGALIGLTGAVVNSFRAAGESATESIAAHQEAALRADEARRTGESAAADRARREAEKAEEAAQTETAVDTLAQAMQELAAGNLGFRIRQPLFGRIDGLRQSFNESLEKLETALSEVGLSAQTVRGDASSIRGSNDELSTRTERQAVSVEETAAALSEISQTVNGTAKLAADVAQLVENTKGGAERSASIVTQAVSAMSRIEESSNQIGQIIGVIDEIAFQTNLLALNAGVEAARAGEAGKGFAVVAQEVRELAQRSAQAAKEIKALITASATQVKHGVELVGETGVALQTIEGEVRIISGQIQQIVHAARDQSSAIGNINSTINMIDQNTQQYAAMVEESTAAVHSLVNEAARLESLLGRFSLDSRAVNTRRAA